jgi:hypothetical protein
MGGFTFGERGWMVECDPATRAPVQGGRVIGCTAAQFHVNGDTEVVGDEFMPGTQARFDIGGWAEGRTRDGSGWRPTLWHLVKEEAVTLISTGEDGRPVYYVTGQGA